MKYKDYYKILGLETSRVSIEEIKSAYRASAKKYHPDLNVGDNLAEERIKDINEAYRILSAPASKKNMIGYGILEIMLKIIRILKEKIYLLCF